MTKEEILRRAIKENEGGDEREKKIEMTANDNSNLIIMSFFLILAVISSVQEFVCRESFADYKVFVLAFLVGNIGHYLTKYYYYKEKKLLGYSILFATLSICTLIGIIVKA
jgi:uncharacterized membrane-anchored protein